MLRLITLAVIAFAVFVTLNSEPEPQQNSDPDLRVLFIGNSFTFGGDVPTQVKNIAATSTPALNLHVEMVVRGGTSLEEHLAETDAMSRVREGGWDIVVLQDSSVMSFRPDWTDRMTIAATTLASAATEQGSSIVYFAHWAPQTEARNIPRAIRTIEQTYARLARRTGGQTARAGRVWQLAETAGMDGLYASDKHHASIKGAYAAALAITATLGDINVATSTWAPDSVSQDEQDILRAAAMTASGDSSAPVVVNRGSN